MNSLLVCFCSMLIMQPPALARPTPAEIPREVATMVLWAFNLDTTALRIGSAAAALPAAAILPGSRVLGGLEGELSNVTVLSFAIDYPTAARSLQMSLESQGWRPAEITGPPGAEAPGGGRGLPRTPELYCLGDQTLRVSPSRVAAITTTVVITLMPNEGVAPCDTTDAIPPIVYPPGAVIAGRTFGGTTRLSTNSATRTRLAPREVVSLFSPKLQAAGWTTIDSSLSDRLAFTTMRIETRSRASVLLLAAFADSAGSTVQLYSDATIPCTAACQGQTNSAADTAPTISTDFINGLLSATYMAGRGIVIGGPADGFPASVLPSNISVAAWARLAGAGTISVATSSLPVETSTAMIDSAARAQGFIPAPSSAPATLEHGFHPSNDAAPTTPSLCRGLENLIVGGVNAITRANKLLIFHLQGAGTTCNPAGRGSSLMSATTPVPSLMGPPAARLERSWMSTSSRGDDSNFQIHGTIKTSLQLSDVMSHYTDQLMRQGWTSIDVASGTLTGLRTYRRTAANGASWTGTFSVHRPSMNSGVYHLHFSGERR